MIYSALADAALIAHMTFIVYVIAGGFAAWRFPLTLWLHILAVTWGFATIVVGLDCPLTDLETWARIKAGQEGLPSTGFIDHYLTGVIYPDSAVGLMQTLVAVCVLVSWIGFGVIRARRAHSGVASTRRIRSGL